MGYLIGIGGSFILAFILATLYTWKDFKKK
jgi:hypothetical protein